MYCAIKNLNKDDLPVKHLFKLTKISKSRVALYHDIYSFYKRTLTNKLPKSATTYYLRFLHNKYECLKGNK